MFVYWIGDPVDAWIVSDGIVEWVYENHFIIFISSVLCDPVGIKNA